MLVRSVILALLRVSALYSLTMQALYVKKVALMFLTTRRLAHEKLWRLWMWDAAGMLPLQALPLAQVSSPRAPILHSLHPKAFLHGR